MVMSNSDVVNTLYNLDSHNDIKHYFYIPENFNCGGIYCFLSKDGLSFYIGSTVNMQTRYSRHMFNLKLK